MKPLLPAYPKMGTSYSTKVFLPEKKKINIPVAPQIESIRFTDVYSSPVKKKLPERETIRPTKEIRREIISPENKSDSTN